MLFNYRRFVIYFYQKRKVVMMRKVLSLFVLLGVGMASATAAPSYLTRDASGGYRVTYDYTDKAKSGWYIGARADLNFLNWENKYSVDDGLNAPDEYSRDKYSFEPVIGGSIFGGKTFAYFWRAELEAGYMGYFEDKDPEAEFSLQIPYLMLNGYYDFINGFYVGAGVGAAMPITTIDLGPTLVKSDGTSRKEYGFSPMAAVMLGYSYELDDNLVLDVRYRLSGMTGIDQNIDIYVGDEKHWFQNDIDFILDNSISLGIRYEF